MTLEALTAAVELHRPTMYDKYGDVTTESDEMKHRRCKECGLSVTEVGCRTWQTANR